MFIVLPIKFRTEEEGPDYESMGIKISESKEDVKYDVVDTSVNTDNIKYIAPTDDDDTVIVFIDGTLVYTDASVESIHKAIELGPNDYWINKLDKVELFLTNREYDKARNLLNETINEL